MKLTTCGRLLRLFLLMTLVVGGVRMPVHADVHGSPAGSAATSVLPCHSHAAATRPPAATQLPHGATPSASDGCGACAHHCGCGCTLPAGVPGAILTGGPLTQCEPPAEFLAIPLRFAPSCPSLRPPIA